MIQIEIADRQHVVDLDVSQMRASAEDVLLAEHYLSAEISIAIVDNAEMRTLNRRFLNHDWPTDVLSFCFDEERDTLAGEVVLNAEMAAEVAERYDWTPPDELLLYLVHGLLHLCGYDDRDEPSQVRMRRRETALLTEWGLHPVYDGDPAQGMAARATAPSGEKCWTREE